MRLKSGAGRRVKLNPHKATTNEQPLRFDLRASAGCSLLLLRLLAAAAVLLALSACAQVGPQAYGYGYGYNDQVTTCAPYPYSGGAYCWTRVRYY